MSSRTQNLDVFIANDRRWPFILTLHMNGYKKSEKYHNLHKVNSLG